MSMRRLAVLALPLLIAAAASPERDWATVVRTNAQAFHDDIAANHPGPVNRLDPGFAVRNDAVATF